MKKLSFLARQCNVVFKHLIMSLRKPHLLKFLFLISIHGLNGVLFLHIYMHFFIILGLLLYWDHWDYEVLKNPPDLQIGTIIDSGSQYLDPVAFFNIT